MELQGIRVIDFSQYLPGPFATLRLAMLGAEVIKIEALEGEPARQLGAVSQEAGLVFKANNQQKKSIAIQLKAEEGRELALNLISKADVVIESFRPGVMNRLGLGYEQMKERKPDIIYCSMSGYGQNSPLKELGSHDLNYMSLSGVLTQLKDSEQRPVHPTIQLADLVGGLAANEAILAALVKRERSGKGGYLDLSLTYAILSLMNSHRLIEEETGRRQGIPYIDGSTISYQIYETKDQRFVSLGALEFKFWRNFCLAVQKEEWLDAHLSAAEEGNPIYLEVSQLFKSRSLDEWTQFGLQVDCCLTPVLEVGEEWRHPYFQKRSQSDEGPQAPAPQLGEDTEDLLTQLFQYDKLNLVELREKGVIL